MRKTYKKEQIIDELFVIVRELRDVVKTLNFVRKRVKRKPMCQPSWHPPFPEHMEFSAWRVDKRKLDVGLPRNVWAHTSVLLMYVTTDRCPLLNYMILLHDGHTLDVRRIYRPVDVDDDRRK